MHEECTCMALSTPKLKGTKFPDLLPHAHLINVCRGRKNLVHPDTLAIVTYMKSLQDSAMAFSIRYTCNCMAIGYTHKDESDVNLLYIITSIIGNSFSGICQNNK